MKNKYRTKVKLTQIDLYILMKGLEGVKALCDKECPTELLWSRDYVNSLMHRLSVHLNDFEEEGR